MEHKQRFENQNEWSRKSKAYKTKTFAALKQLYGSAQNAKDGESVSPANGTAGTNSICGVVEKTGV